MQRRSYTPAPSSTASSSVSTVSSRLKKYTQQMKFKNAPGGEASRPPWSQILGTWMLWVTTLQAMGQAWSGVMMILMVKEYLEEIHGYSLQEAAIMVTIPNNLTQFFLGLGVGYLGDLLIKKKVAARTVRRLGSGIQMLACLPLLLLPFLPCSWIDYRASMVVIQSLASFRVFGNLAGYSSYRDISPTFHRHLFGLSSILSLSVPGVLVPVLMGGFGTTRRDQWQQLFPLNCSVVILTNLLYIFLVTTDTAVWEPTRYTITQHYIKLQCLFSGSCVALQTVSWRTWLPRTPRGGWPRLGSWRTGGTSRLQEMLACYYGSGIIGTNRTVNKSL